MVDGIDMTYSMTLVFCLFIFTVTLAVLGAVGFYTMANRVYDKTTDPDPELNVPLFILLLRSSNPELITDFYLRHKPLQIGQLWRDYAEWDIDNIDDAHSKMTLRLLLANASNGYWQRAEEIVSKIKQQEVSSETWGDKIYQLSSGYYRINTSALSEAVGTRDENTLRLSEPYDSFFKSERKIAMLKARSVVGLIILVVTLIALVIISQIM